MEVVVEYVAPQFPMVGTAGEGLKARAIIYWTLLYYLLYYTEL